MTITARPIGRRDIDPDLLVAAWTEAWEKLDPEARERIMVEADETGGMFNKLTLESNGDLVISMGPVEVLRCAARWLVRLDGPMA